MSEPSIRLVGARLPDVSNRVRKAPDNVLAVGARPKGGGFGSIPHVVPLAEMAYMRLDRSRGDIHLDSRLFVGQPQGQQPDDLPLASRSSMPPPGSLTLSLRR